MTDAWSNRISATDHLETLPEIPSWKVEDSIKLAGILAEHGVDFIDVSSAGNHPRQALGPLAHTPAFQANFSAQIKAAVGDKILVGAVGGITSGTLAQSILDEGKADVIFVGRMFQKNPGLVWAFADELGVELHHSLQIGWGFQGRALKKQSQEK